MKNNFYLFIYVAFFCAASKNIVDFERENRIWIFVFFLLSAPHECHIFIYECYERYEIECEVRIQIILDNKYCITFK